MPLTCILDGRSINDTADLYDQLAAQLPMPPGFGRNLDALWDVLTTDIPGPLTIIWQHAGQSRQKLDKRYLALRTLLEEAMDERPDLTVRFEGD